VDVAVVSSTVSLLRMSSP